MKTLVKINKSKDISKLNLKGIEVEEVLEGSGGTEYRGLKLRDTVTGTLFSIQMTGGYSEFSILTEKGVEYKEVFILNGELEGANVSKRFETEEEAQQFATKIGLQKFVVGKDKVEVE